MKTLKKISSIILIISSLFTSGYSATTKGGYGACISKSYYNEWNQADQNGMKYLMESKKCTILRSGLEYSMVDRGLFSSIIRIYLNGTSLKVWTANENIR